MNIIMHEKKGTVRIYEYHYVGDGSSIQCSSIIMYEKEKGTVFRVLPSPWAPKP